MIRPWVRVASGSVLLIGILGSGPCLCLDDECDRPGESWCQDNIAYTCAEPNENGAYSLIVEDCNASARICHVPAEGESEFDAPRAACADSCPDGSVCDQPACDGDGCVSAPDGATDAIPDAVPDSAADATPDGAADAAGD